MAKLEFIESPKGTSNKALRERMKGMHDFYQAALEEKQEVIELLFSLLKDKKKTAMAEPLNKWDT